MFSSSHRKICVLLLAAVLTAPLTAAAEPGARIDQQAWDVLARLWNALTVVWGDNGCMIDPYGRCAENNATTPEPSESLDNGCKMDPFGGCVTNTATTESLDNGCSVDPFGGCRSGS